MDYYQRSVFSFLISRLLFINISRLFYSHYQSSPPTCLLLGAYESVVSYRIIRYHNESYRIIVTHNLANKIRQSTETGISNRLGANKRLLKAKKSNKRQMKCRENECTLQGTRIYRGNVTSRYKKYCSPISVGLRRFSDGLVATNLRTPH
jgi:hypothetical protein